MNCYCEEIVSYYQEMKKKIVQSIIFVDNVKNTRKIKKKKKNRFQYFPDNMLWSCGLKATEHLLLTKWFYISCVRSYNHNIHTSQFNMTFWGVFLLKIVTNQLKWIKSLKICKFSGFWDKNFHTFENFGKVRVETGFLTTLLCIANLK